MARIRTIKPEFFTSEDIVCLTPLARLFYVSLWCEADREGRLAWKPKTLKMRYLPADDADPEVLGTELVGAGLIQLYEVDGCIYAWIPGFAKHQVINNKEAASTLPDPKTVTRESGVKVAPFTRDDACEGKEGRKERKELSASAFDAFWSAYPKKVSKGQAEKVFAKINPDDNLQAQMLESLARAKKRPDWIKDGGQFIPHPSTWLNAKGWEDEDLPPPRAGASGQDQIFAGCLL